MFTAIVLPLLKMFGIGLIGWIAIILCSIICGIIVASDGISLQSTNTYTEFLNDANNLFSTAAGYVFLGFWALCLVNLAPIISYIIIGFMIIACLPSVLSILGLFKNPPHIVTAMLFLSGVINTFTPLLMALYLLTNYII